GFEKLQAYVDDFKPCKVMTSLGEVALDKHGRMADLACELMRIAAEKKGEKPKKKARRSKPHILVADQAASGSITQSSSV
ncbi:hypothetical protein L195_g061052, partial [Trifolium pratense]